MNIWDKKLAKLVRDRYGEGAERFLTYKIDGGADGIAMSKNAAAFARVELSLDFGKFNEGNVILSGLFSFKFASDSCLLQSGEFTALEDHGLSKRAEETVDPKDNGLLQSQFVFPSVISLDRSSSTSGI